MVKKAKRFAREFIIAQGGRMSNPWWVANEDNAAQWEIRRKDFDFFIVKQYEKPMRERGFFSSYITLPPKCYKRGLFMKYPSLTRNNDFLRTYKRGRSWAHSQVVLYVNKNRLAYTRVGITASKKVGGAVVRNRARRVIRAALAETLPQNVGGMDVVLVARGRTPHVKSTVLAQTLRKLFKQAGLAVLPFSTVEQEIVDKTNK